MDGPRRAQSLRRRLVLSGIGCLVVTVGLAVALLVATLDDFPWPDDSTVVQDGKPSLVQVEPGERFFVWVWTADPGAEQCVFKDSVTDALVRLEPAPPGWFRSGGANPWEATLAGVSESGQLTVTCSDLDGPAARFRVATPDGPRLLDGFGPLWRVPACLGALGIVLLAVAGPLWPILRRNHLPRGS